MKAVKLLAPLCVFLTAFLVAGIALANDSTVFDSVRSDRSALAAPVLTVTTSGTAVSLSWNPVASATGYTLFYAPAPYTGSDSIGSIPLGDQTTMSASLWENAAFFIAIQAYDSVQSSEYSNIELFTILPIYTNSLGQEFKLIPAGTFTMGSPSDEPGRDPDEGPQHQVTLTQPFYMQNTEVTQEQWEAVMGTNPSYFTGCPTCPVEMVSWDDVQTYISYMNTMGEGTYSLPTEAQWEYAVRAGSTTAFYNGGITDTGCKYDPNLDAIGWYCYNADSETHPVARKAPNAWGLYDMSGNVYEWCQDWLGNYPAKALTDPTGPSSGPARVTRGGSWYNSAKHSRSANRSNSLAICSGSALGFRLTRQP